MVPFSVGLLAVLSSGRHFDFMTTRQDKFALLRVNSSSVALISTDPFRCHCVGRSFLHFSMSMHHVQRRSLPEGVCAERTKAAVFDDSCSRRTALAIAGGAATRLQTT